MKNLYQQIRITILKHREAVPFIRKHRLWKGLLSYGWVSRMLMIIGIVLGFKLFLAFVEGIKQMGQVEDGMVMASIMGDLFGDFFSGISDLLFDESIKYVMLVLLEIVIFHFVRKTLEILTKKKEGADFKSFVKAQIRMLKIAGFSWLAEVIFTAISGAVLGIFGVEFTHPVFIFLAQSYLMGFAIIDNYNEIYEMKIKESARRTFRYAGVAIGTGAVLQVLMLVPVTGPILGPLIAAVAATLVMYQLTKEEMYSVEDLVPDVKHPKPLVP